MSKQNNLYGPYLFSLLGQMLKAGSGGTEKRPMQQQAMPVSAPVTRGATKRPEEMAADSPFTVDETGSIWRREERLDLLLSFCREGYAMAKKYGHFLIGTAERGNFIAIPGRFLAEEQPAGGKTGFTLWQPLRGGEELFDSLESISETASAQIYGYWIAALDPANLQLSEV